MCDGCGACTRNATDWVTLEFGPAVQFHEVLHACSSPCLETLSEKLRPENPYEMPATDLLGKRKWNRDRVRHHRNGAYRG